MSNESKSGRTKVIAVCALLLALCVGFYVVAAKEFPAPTQPVEKELPHALLLPDTQ